MEPKRLGFLKVTKELLCEVLHLPADADIHQVKWEWEHDVLYVKFSSERCPVVYEDQEVPQVYPRQLEEGYWMEPHV